MMQPQDFYKIIDGIDRALFMFESTSNDAVLRLYRRSNFASKSMEKSTRSSLEDSSMLAESEHEHIFLVYLLVGLGCSCLDCILICSCAALFLPYRSLPGN